MLEQERQSEAEQLADQDAADEETVAAKNESEAVVTEDTAEEPAAEFEPNEETVLVRRHRRSRRRI